MHCLVVEVGGDGEDGKVDEVGEAPTALTFLTDQKAPSLDSQAVVLG
jgi:hypothetical protein